MSTFDSNRPRKKFPIVIVVLAAVVVALAAAAIYFAPRLERDGPQVSLATQTDVLGRAPLDILVSDAGSGLRSVTAILAAGDSEHAVAAERLAEPAAQKKIVLALSELRGVKEGPAVLRVYAKDNALFANETVFEKKLTIDVTPPTLELIADDRYINFGGAGAIVYKAAADTVKSGVRIGDYFFPGFEGQVKGEADQRIAFFAHPYNVPVEARAALVATDAAGNTREMPLFYQVMNAKFRKSTIGVSETFIQRKVAPLLNGVDAQAGPKEIFIAVNNRLRKENEDKIASITRQATPSILWKGAFVQLSNSKVEANFADERTYTYNGAAIDTAHHLGYDLSVTKRYPVEAANSGKVAFAGDLGIYGNTVILDHGLGLFTLYSHLSSIDVKEGDALTQRQVLGKTGETGLAGGDHLHYGVYLHGVAVLPLEWWDQKWLNDNVLPKLGEPRPDAARKTTQTRRR